MRLYLPRSQPMIYEHLGDNRSGKTFTNALFAWEAYNLGRTVYCNCGKDASGRSLHILNFPHRHYQFEELRQMDLYECYVMSDESVEFMDAFDAPKRMMREKIGRATSNSSHSSISYAVFCLKKKKSN